MKITVVYDNEVLKEGLKSGWGFSCLIDDDVLFDTGDDGAALLYNMEKLDINPRDLKSVVISHAHWDHTGGLSELLKENQELAIYAPPGFCETLKNRIPEKTKLISCQEPTLIRKGVSTTGTLNTFIEEQGLVCLTKKGALVVLGCSHPGVDRLVDAASKLGKVYGVIGGFHGFSKLEALKGLEVISPCHCTQSKREIQQAFPKQCIKCGAGLVLE
ncbi:MAG TPA: MBL fold metallo-hydrolase [Hadesarchaea archaeon]|nr:MBL fold metallo-hydrolase [Hadesarchaea archaeon]